MTDYPYRAPCSYFLVYVYEIPRSVDYAGLLKVWNASSKSPKKAGELAVCGSVYVYPALGKL